MKKIIILSISVLLSPLLSLAQNPVLFFDGTNDYIDLGNNVGNSVRTIEMWFRPKVEIDASISDFSALVARNNLSSLNENEFNISFSKKTGFKGKLHFSIDDEFGNGHIIYSDSSMWKSNEWYHVAGVVDSTKGMRLFINGIKQSDTNSYVKATGILNKATAIGRWGDTNTRYFQGYIDDIRISSEALYSSNFTPPCPDLSSQNSTIALYNLNENSGISAVDASQNQNNGQIIGASWDTAFICSKPNNLELKKKVSLSIYPNPSKGIFNFQIKQKMNINGRLQITNSMGKLILIKKIESNNILINLKNESKGLYYYTLYNSSSILQKGTLVKN